MNKYLFLFPLILSTLSSFGQGIYFENGDWPSVVARARKEQKLVYVDFYTTWCGPCKTLEKQVFPQKEVGDKYNALFVNYRIDAEKGEGIELAKKYSVSSYPTNLFVDPTTGDVICRISGTTGKITDFNAQADMAIQEKADPMTLDKYAALFNSRRRDYAFLRAYIAKADRTEQNNDEILNAYVTLLEKAPAVDSEITYVAYNIMTFDNNAVPYIAAHKPTIDSMSPGNAHYFNDLARRWTIATVTKAITEKRESLLEKALKDAETYIDKKDEPVTFWLRIQYYTKVGDDNKAFAAKAEEAGFYAAKPDTYFAAQDAELFTAGGSGTHIDLKLTDEAINEIVKTYTSQHPLLSYYTSRGAAAKFNDMACRAYEQHAKDKGVISQALNWSKRSLGLTRGTKDWPSYANTYAHLLYKSGLKDEAIKMQQQAVAERKGQNEDATLLEASLKRMKTGEL